jgi:hypothetical protein
MAQEFTPGEFRLMQMFNRYLLEIFGHEAAKPGAPLRENVILHMVDDIEIAGDIAPNLGALASGLCQRAHHWYLLSEELSDFLCATGPSDLEDLPAFQGLEYTAELVRKHGDLLRNQAEVTP